MIKGVTHAHLEPIWYHSELSDVSKFPKLVSWLGLFLPLFKDGSTKNTPKRKNLFGRSAQLAKNIWDIQKNLVGCP